jgi:hypothetical protein
MAPKKTSKQHHEKELRNVPISFKITRSLKTALVNAAEADRRPVSSFIEIALETLMRERGFLQGRPPHA